MAQAKAVIKARLVEQAALELALRLLVQPVQGLSPAMQAVQEQAAVELLQVVLRRVRAQARSPAAPIREQPQPSYRNSPTTGGPSSPARTRRS